MTEIPDLVNPFDERLIYVLGMLYVQCFLFLKYHLENIFCLIDIATDKHTRGQSLE